MNQASVYVLSGPQQGKTLAIVEPPFVASTTPGGDFYIDPEATPEAQGREIRIDRSEDGWEIRSLGAGEVMVNQAVITGTVRLRSGDVIRLSAAGPEFSFVTTVSQVVDAVQMPSAPVPAGEQAEGEGNHWWARNQVLAGFLVVVLSVVAAVVIFGGKAGESLGELPELPELAVMDDVTIMERAAFTVTASLEGDVPAEVDVRYRLDSGPSGMTIDERRGVIAWTPGEGWGGRQVTVLVVCGLARGDSYVERMQEFVVDVREDQQAPLMYPLQDYVLSPGGDNKVRVQVTAEDPDVPPSPLAYAIVGFESGGEAQEIPEALLFDPRTGHLVWEPGKDDLGKTYRVRVRVEKLGQEGLVAERAFQIRLPVATAASASGAAYLLVMEPKGSRDQYPIGNAFAFAPDMLVTSGEVAVQLVQRQSDGWQIKARRAVAGNRENVEIKEVTVHRMFEQFSEEEQRQIFFDVGLVRIAPQEHEVTEFATAEEWTELERGLPMKCLSVAYAPGEALTRFDDPTAVLFPVRLLALNPFPPLDGKAMPGAPLLLQVTGTLPEGCVGSPVVNERGHCVGVYAERAVIPEEHPLATRYRNRLHYIAPTHLVRAWVEGKGREGWMVPKVRRRNKEQEDNE